MGELVMAIEKDDPFVREFNGEYYATCWLDRNTLGGLLEFYAGNHGGWAAQFRFVNIEDIDKPIECYRTFNWGYELPRGWLTEEWLNMLWNRTIAHGRLDRLVTSWRTITLCVSSVGIDLVNKLIDVEAERRDKPVDVL